MLIGSGAPIRSLCARGRPNLHDADVSEFRLRILMPRPVSPFVISKRSEGHAAEQWYPPFGRARSIRRVEHSTTCRERSTQIPNHGLRRSDQMLGVKDQPPPRGRISQLELLLNNQANFLTLKSGAALIRVDSLYHITAFALMTRIPVPRPMASDCATGATAWAR
jgi:hypothetical protein